MSCTALGTSPQLQDIVKCAFDMSIGNGAIAAIVVFAIFLYGMHKLRVPFMIQVPVGLFILYVFAGTSIGEAVPAFSTLMLFAIILFGAVGVLLLWRWRH
jgi:hypothetical protein